MAMPSDNDRIFELLSREDNIVVLDPPKIDLDSYLQNYSGRTRFERLFFIGQHSVSLCVDALKAAVVEAKSGRDCTRYRAAQEKLAAAGPHEPEAVYDKEWVDRVMKENSAKTKRLEDELKGYKNNLIKESIRMGNEDLGSHYQEIGDLERAYDSFNKMRHEALVHKHTIDVCRNLISVSIEQGKWVTVQSNVQKIMAVPQPVEDEKALQPYMKISQGLANLAEGKFHEAALSFLGVDSGMGSTYNHTASPNDIAVYGGLCALASMDRAQLQQRVLENSNFRTYLELEPHIRRAVAFFVNGRYSACLSTLEGYRNDYLLDIYLQSQVATIYQLIRSKSIIQYFIPFSCVTLDSMETAFNLPGRSVEEELVRMIQGGSLEARIDKQNQLLTSLPSAPRASLQNQAIATANIYEREMRNRLLRMNILGAGLDVRGPKKGQNQGPGSILDSMYPADGLGRRTRGFHDSLGHDSGYE